MCPVPIPEKEEPMGNRRVNKGNRKYENTGHFSVPTANRFEQLFKYNHLN